MTPFEEYSQLISSIFAFLTLSAVIIAIWGERARQIWSKPKLKIEVAEPTLTSHTDVKKGLACRLRNLVHTREKRIHRNTDLFRDRRHELCRRLVEIFPKG